MPKGRKRTGQELPCPICQAPVYYEPLQIARGVQKTCGNIDCKRANMSGRRNPYWGKKHSLETKAKIRANRTPPKKKTGPPKGWTHSPEARARISQSVRERWRVNRDLMMSQLPRGDDHPFRKLRDDNREGLYFTPWQRQNWIGGSCLYCEAPDDLVLDHIIPVMAGGRNLQSNSQTLCRKCNLWKAKYVDLPYYWATLGSKGG